MTMIRHRGLAVLVAAMMTLNACSATTSGHGTARPGSVDAFAGTRFDDYYKEAVVSLYTGRSMDSRTKTYTLATYGDKKVALGSTVIRVGSPPSVYEQSAVTRTGQNLDAIHISGEQLDYLLLGDTFRSLSPTPWVSFPTYYDRGPDKNCTLPGLVEVCKIGDGIQATLDRDHGELVREVSDDGHGGHVLLTGISVAAIVDLSIIGFSPQMRTTFSDADRSILVPTRITVDDKGRMTQIEVNGALPAGDRRPAVAIQLGAQISFAVTTSDIPPPPAPFDITALPDRAASENLYANITKLRPQTNP